MALIGCGMVRVNVSDQLRRMSPKAEERQNAKEKKRKKKREMILGKNLARFLPSDAS